MIDCDMVNEDRDARLRIQICPGIGKGKEPQGFKTGGGGFTQNLRSFRPKILV